MSEMSLDRVIELLKIERECVLRQNGNGCQRENTNCCVGCDLVQSDNEIFQMYNVAIDKLTLMNSWADLRKDSCPCGREEL